MGDETEKKLQSHAKVVIIGGGVVGCSILFTLPNSAGKMWSCWSVMS